MLPCRRRRRIRTEELEIPYPWYIISSLSAALGAVIVVAAAVYGHFQLREAHRARNVSTLMEFHDFYHSLAIRDVRRRLLAGELGPAEKLSTTQALSADEKHRLWQMIDKLEFLAALINRGLVDFEVAYSVFSYSPPLVFEAIRPVVEDRRHHGHPRYCRQLELLVGRYRREDRRHPH